VATVVVATTFARTTALHRCVESLLALDYPRYEVLVVDNRRSPVAADWAALPVDSRLRVLAEPVPGASAARNRGLAAATGTVVAFTDDDVAVDRNWLRALAGRLVEEPDVACVTGLVLPAELETPAQIWFEESGSNFARRYRRATFRAVDRRRAVVDRHADDPSRTASLYALGPFGTGSNMAFRTGVLRALGGFDVALGPGTPALAGEDIHVFVRLLYGGEALAFEPGAFVRHWHRRTYPELRAQLRGYGVGFSAMLTAAVLAEPGHLRGLLRMVGPGLRSMLGGRSEKTSARGAGYPAELGRVELLGMIMGPVAYLRSRSRMQRWKRR
jgi:glycosyltransferase involved in cell wall biosynthesis